MNGNGDFADLLFIASRILQDLKSKLEEKKPTLEEAQGLCDKLTDQNKDEPLVVAAVKDKLDKVEMPFEDLKAKITELEGRLQAAQIRCQEFNVSFGDFTNKLQNMEELASKLQPVSAVYDTLKQQKSDVEVKICKACKPITVTRPCRSYTDNELTLEFRYKLFLCFVYMMGTFSGQTVYSISMNT